MNKALTIATGIIFLVSVSVSCSKGGSSGGGGNPPPPPPPPLDCNTVTNKAFAANVNPIIQSFCNAAGCHASGSFNGPGAITNYNEVFNNRVAIRAAIASGRMPQTGTLTTAQKNSILCWIDSGAPNN